MNCSKIVAAALVGLLSALVLVQAGHYGGGASGSSSGSAHSLAHYGGGACHGYGCNNQAPRPASNGPYGPYHSYAVRPVVYGGHGLYNYKGYARHAPAPAAGHQRYARSYGTGSRGRPAGRYATPARHYAPAPMHQPSYDHHRGQRSAGHYRQQQQQQQQQQQHSSYGSGHAPAYGSSHYEAGYSQAHQMRPHQGGYRQQHAGGNQGSYGGY